MDCNLEKERYQSELVPTVTGLNNFGCCLRLDYKTVVPMSLVAIENGARRQEQF